ncbi:MAG: hypothetical protein CSB28_00445 [Desulfobacterales bacterium]|nr:MAG: hypothetical protein CSB28_00445 [Desulfobacterales bacterium]
MTQLAVLDADAGKMAEEISDYTFLAEDYVARLRSYKDSLQTDPYRLDQINERLDQISQLKRKYGESIRHILDFLQSSEEELNRLDSMDREIGELETEVSELEANVCRLAAELSLARHSTANFLEKQMTAELSSLSFESPTFQVHWEDVSQVPETLRAVGWDRAEFYFSANPGEAVKPFARIASGGELSRLLLAMKCLLARKDMVETVIFDEVDSGIGGEAAEAVARKIQELSSHHQVFCITHLPQIAARGSMHFEVRKMVENGRTRTKVVRLSEEQRVAEIVRMLAGDSATEQTRAWAMELLRGNRRSTAE